MGIQYKKNDKVIIRLGRGVVISVDTTTYSVPMFTVELITGKYIGTYVCVCENEMNRDGVIDQTDGILYSCPQCGTLNILDAETPTDQTFFIYCSYCGKMKVINADYFHPYID